VLQFTGFVGFGPQTPMVQFCRESGATHDVVTKGASRRSNFVKSVWPSNRYSRSWSILPLGEWIGYVYLGVV
jgi:hypothetical protein